MALTVSQKTAKKKKTFHSLGVENRSLQLCGNLKKKKKTAKNNSRFQVFEFPILVSWLIDAVSAFIPPRKGLWRLTPTMETFELFQNNRSASKYLPLTVNASTKLSPFVKQLLERKTRSDLLDLIFLRSSKEIG